MSEHQPSPGDFNREDQPAMSCCFVCEGCGDPLRTGRRFCSRSCYEEWQREPKPRPMTFEEMEAEMKGVFDRLASHPEEETS